MEALTRMVADSLARHGLDRPVDPRRLQWSRWSRCDSPHSLLVVPSKPGIFALAEEVMDLSNAHVGTDAFVRPAQTTTAHVGAAPGCPAEQSSAAVYSVPTVGGSIDSEGHAWGALPREGQEREAQAREERAREGYDFSRAVMPAENSPALAASSPLGGAALQRCESAPLRTAALAAEVPQRRLLAVLQFSEDDDMAFTLDRMFTRINPMRDRLASGRCFLRFVVMEDQAQRRSICAALNQWMLSSAEKASGLPPDFSSSLEFVARAPSPATAASSTNSVTPSQRDEDRTNVVSIDSGSAKNLHCPHPLPSGF